MAASSNRRSPGDEDGFRLPASGFRLPASGFRLPASGFRLPAFGFPLPAMTRVLSALVLLPVVIGAIWFLPPWGTLLLALIASVLAFSEYRTIARALGVAVPSGVGGIAVVLCAYAMYIGDRWVDGGSSSWELGGSFFSFTSVWGSSFQQANSVPLILMSAFIVAGAIAVANGRPAPGVLADAAATLFAPIYIGLPLGALAWVRTDRWFASGVADVTMGLDGRVAVLLLLAVIVVSDSAQYYCGRTFGKRPLAPSISPKKTVEGAIGGFIFGTLAMAAAGHWVFASPFWILALLGATIAVLGMVGDLFESLLKRSAGVKDSSNLIPGHGGVLDRIDSWLFAAPVYYVFVRFVA
jgi:phosphatidate cytidylyltransferase